MERWVQALETRGIVASHGVLVQVDGHGTIGVELAGRLTMQRLLVTLRTGRTGRGIVLIHIRGLLITHGDQQIPNSQQKRPECGFVELMLRRERKEKRERERARKEIHHTKPEQQNPKPIQPLPGYLSIGCK